LKITRFSAIPNEVRHNLTGTPTQGHPDPALLIFFEHKRPDFIQFQYILQTSFRQCLFQGRQHLRPSFNPSGDGSTRNSQQPFQHGALDLNAPLVPVPALHQNRSVATTIFAGVFLCALIIMSIFDQLRAAAARAVMRYTALYHEKVLRITLAVFPRVPFHALSVNISPLSPSAVCSLADHTLWAPAQVRPVPSNKSLYRY
jgi:hypothetical protein